jgi:single-stranded-DNA-specific exonuclease
MSRVVIRREMHSVGEGVFKDVHPLLQRLYQARGIESPGQIGRELPDLLPYQDMLNIHEAAAHLAQAIQSDRRILIIGDFDTDGATSTALAMMALQNMGAKNVDFLVPNRFVYGYGLSPGIVDLAHQQKNPDLIVTVDNGISSHEGVARAKNLGIDVLVTDHHLPGDKLPTGATIVDPNQPGDKFGSKCIAGVGVIFYVMLALRARLEDLQWFTTHNIPRPNMAHYLDLVALGTVADVVPLDKNNRILVHQGLRRIRSGATHLGILALLQLANRHPSRIQAVDLGFVIGPRLNAAGRLDDMSLGIHCLLAKTPAAAKMFAEKLDELNCERRALEAQMQQEAFEIVQNLKLGKKLPLGISLYDPTWHQGVVGLIAARVKEKFHRPVIAFAKGEDGLLKGSARSIANLNIRDVLEKIAIHYPGLITKFGGHAMAAGLSLSPESFGPFTQAFSETVAEEVGQNELCHKIYTDGPLNEDEFTFEIAEMLRHGGPWGPGFPEPLFDGEFKLINQRLVGRRHLKMVLQAPGSEQYLDAIAFNIDLNEWPNYERTAIRLAFRMDINEYRGRKKLQLVVEEIL